MVCAVTAGGAGEPTPALERLSFDADGSTVTVVLKTSGPVGGFLCGLPSPSSPDVWVEFPSTTSKLQTRYALDGRLLREAIVEPGTGAGKSLRVRLVLADGVLSGIEQSVQGLILRFGESAPARMKPNGLEAAEYKVGAGDKLEIAVFGHEDLSKIVEVRSDGTINYPLIGDVQVKGKSVAEIDDEITRVLGKDYLVDPQVSVDVREYQSQWVTV